MCNGKDKGPGGEEEGAGLSCDGLVLAGQGEEQCFTAWDVFYILKTVRIKESSSPRL